MNIHTQKIHQFRSTTLNANSTYKINNECENCDNLKIKIEDLHETLPKFARGRYDIDIILSNLTWTYNKVSLSYQAKNNGKTFNKICPAKNKINHSVFKCNYCSRNDYIAPYCFDKIHDLKLSHRSS